MKSTIDPEVTADANTTLKDIKDMIGIYLTERGWDNLDERSLAISITLEASELLEHYQWTNDSSSRDGSAIADELADTLIYCIEFALARNIDIIKALYSKIARVKEKYPVTIFKPGAHDAIAYHEIKKTYREGKKK